MEKVYEVTKILCGIYTHKPFAHPCVNTLLLNASIQALAKLSFSRRAESSFGVARTLCVKGTFPARGQKRASGRVDPLFGLCTLMQKMRTSTIYGCVWEFCVRVRKYGAHALFMKHAQYVNTPWMKCTAERLKKQKNKKNNPAHFFLCLMPARFTT